MPLQVSFFQQCTLIESCLGAMRVIRLETDQGNRGWKTMLYGMFFGPGSTMVLSLVCLGVVPCCPFSHCPYRDPGLPFLNVARTKSAPLSFSRSLYWTGALLQESSQANRRRRRLSGDSQDQPMGAGELKFPTSFPYGQRVIEVKFGISCPAVQPLSSPCGSCILGLCLLVT